MPLNLGKSEYVKRKGQKIGLSSLQELKRQETLNILNGSISDLRRQIKSGNLPKTVIYQLQQDINNLEKKISELKAGPLEQTVIQLKFSCVIMVRKLPYQPGQKLVKMQLRDDAPFNRTVHLRIEVPGNKGAVSYAISETPGKNVLEYLLPLNSFVFTANKPEWSNPNRKERRLMQVTPDFENETYFVKNALYSEPIVP